MGPIEPTVQTLARNIEQTRYTKSNAISGLASKDDTKQKESYTNIEYYADLYLVKLEAIFQDMEINGNPPPIIENRFYFGDQIAPNGFN